MQQVQLRQTVLFPKMIMYGDWVMYFLLQQMKTILQCSLWKWSKKPLPVNWHCVIHLSITVTVMLQLSAKWLDLYRWCRLSMLCLCNSFIYIYIPLHPSLPLWWFGLYWGHDHHSVVPSILSNLCCQPTVSYMEQGDCILLYIALPPAMWSSYWPFFSDASS
jgi:hypothetical protein